MTATTDHAPPRPPPAGPPAEPPNNDRPSGVGGDDGLTRVTVNLTGRSVTAMTALVHSLGCTKTDAINRALQVFAHLDEVDTAGGRIYVRDAGSDVLERLRFL